MATGDPVVATDAAEAAVCLEQGSRLVLISGDEFGPSPLPGRMAVMVGDPGDTAVLKAAEEMAAELFAPATDRTGSIG